MRNLSIRHAILVYNLCFDGGSGVEGRSTRSVVGRSTAPGQYARALRPKQLLRRPAAAGFSQGCCRHGGAGRSLRGRRLTCQRSAVVFLGGLSLRWIGSLGLGSIDCTGMIADGAWCLLILFFVEGFSRFLILWFVVGR